MPLESMRDSSGPATPSLESRVAQFEVGQISDDGEAAHREKLTLCGGVLVDPRSMLER